MVLLRFLHHILDPVRLLSEPIYSPTDLSTSYRSTLLDLVLTTLNACDILFTSTYRRAVVSESWTYWIAAILLLANVLIPLAGHMYKIAKLSSATIVYGVGAAIIGFISIMALAYLGVVSSQASRSRFFSTSSTQIKLYLTVNIFYFLGTLFAVVELFALLMMMRSKVQTGSLMIWIPILCVMLFANALENVIVAGMAYSGTDVTPSGYTTELVFFGIFNIGSYLALLLAGENHVLLEGAADPNAVQINNTRSTGPETNHYAPVQVPGAHNPPLVPVYPYQPQINGHQPNLVPVPGQPHLFQIPGQPGAYYQMPVQQQQPMYAQQHYPVPHQDRTVSPGISEVAPSIVQRTITPVHDTKPVEIEAPHQPAPVELQGQKY